MFRRSRFGLLIKAAADKASQPAKKVVAPSRVPAARIARRPKPARRLAEEEGPAVTSMSAADRATVAAIIRGEHAANNAAPPADLAYDCAVFIENAVALRENRAPRALIPGPPQHEGQRLTANEILEVAKTIGKV